MWQIAEFEKAPHSSEHCCMLEVKDKIIRDKIHQIDRKSNLLRSDLARQSSWRCPTLKLAPYSATKLSIPFVRLLIFLLKWTLDMASLISASVCRSKGSRFSLIVPLKSTGSCQSIKLSMWREGFQMRSTPLVYSIILGPIWISRKLVQDEQKSGARGKVSTETAIHW